MEQEITKPKNVFKNRNFNLVFLGALVSNIGNLFYSFAVSFYILKITSNNALIQGLYLAVGGVVFCVVTLFGGVIGDRYNKAKIMYMCDYIKGIVIIGFTILLMFVIKSVTVQVVSLFVVAIISNAIAGIFSPASSALLPQIVEEDQYQQAESYFSLLSSLQSIVGIILAGILYSLIPINVLFLIVGICYILSGVSEMFIKYSSEYEKNDEKLTTKVVFRDIKDGFKYLVSLKSMFAILICALFINFFFSPIFSNFIPYFIVTDIAESDYMFKSFMAPEIWESIFTVAFGAGSIVMSIIMSSMKPREKYNKIIRYSMLLIALMLYVVSISYLLFKKSTISINTLLIIITSIIMLIGLLTISINVSTTTTLMKKIDKDKFGKVTSVSNIGSQGLIPLGLFLSGLLLSYVGSFGFLIACSTGTFITSLALFFIPSIKEI